MEQKRQDLINEHEAKGEYFNIDGVRVFRLDLGTGDPVVCLHGVPTSSFLYRKLAPYLSDLGFRSIATDLPGLGLSDRPENFDYSFENYSNFLQKIIGFLDISRFHLLVHDIGGPIGFALAAKNQDKILSLTILNTWIDVVNYEKPFIMKPFEKKGIGELELQLVSPITWPVTFKQMGILDPDTVTIEEMNVYVDLLKRTDGGQAFLKIMRNFTSTADFRDLCLSAVKAPPYPVQLLWGAKDIALTYDRYGKEIENLATLDHVSLLYARHFLQEEVWKEIGNRIKILSDR